MNLMAKLKAMQREIDALRARVEALEGPQDPWPGAVPIEIADGMPAVIGKFSCMPAVIGKFSSQAIAGAKLVDGPVQVYEAPWPPLAKPIVDEKPIASATIAPPPKKRGRPPKAT